MSKKRALLLGGTGAMGMRLQSLLTEKFEVVVTTRTKRESTDDVCFIQGNAKDVNFLKKVLVEKWDVIVDFMVYSTKDFDKRIDLLLDATDQYVYLSSARVYADAGCNRLCENSPRLLDVVREEAYLATDEYALSKARQENMLFTSGRKNWTVIRPTLTYNKSKLQLGAYEKENWLYRALHGRSIVFSKDMMDVTFVMCHGDDVAQGIAAVVGNPKAFGEIYNVMGEENITWSEVLEIYLGVLKNYKKITPKVIFTEKCTNLTVPGSEYKLKYGRYLNRFYDSSKIRAFVDNTKWRKADEGLASALTEFLNHPVFGKIDWRKEALIDKVAKEKTPLSEIKGHYNKFTYFCYRYGLERLHTLAEKIIKIKKH